METEALVQQSEQEIQFFELNLLFLGTKDPATAFARLGEVFQFLHDYDQWILNSVSEGLAVEYSIINLEYSSIRSRLAQLLRAIPDKGIEEFEWKKMLGAILLKAKYSMLKRLERNKSIESRDDLDAITRELEKEVRVKELQNRFLVASLNQFVLLDLYGQAIEAINKLADGENVEYVSPYGTARVTNGISFDRGKIISELGEQTLQNETVELLKLKKIDMLSNEARWDFKKDHYALKGVKISDQQWLADFHTRKFSLLPEDSLRVRLKTIYTHSPNPDFSNNSYEILEVLEVIPPNEQSRNLFE